MWVDCVVPVAVEAVRAIALKRAAIEQGYSMLFTPVMVMAASLPKALSEGRLEERLAHYTKPKLLIIDELRYLPLEHNAVTHLATPSARREN